MKVIANTLAIAALASSTAAFAPSPQRSSATTTTATYLEAQKWANPMTAALVGWTLASQVAFAAPPTVTAQPSDIFSSTMTVSAFFDKPVEPTYEKLDFNLPSYDTNGKSAGFGEGAQAMLELQTGQKTEAELQAVAMKRAEAARIERLEQKKLEAKAKAADIKARDAIKKAERDRRMRGIFDVDDE